MISIYRRRRIRNALALTLSLAAATLGLFWLGAILWTLVVNGIGGLNLHVFTMSTPAPGSQGGLLNAIYGSVVMTAIAVAIGTPVGIMAGTYLSEFGKHNALAEATRFVNDILLSAPSIIIGLFVYEAMVLKMGHFSGWAGAVALAIIVIPVVVRTTEDMLQLVPTTLRESAAALGAPQWKVTVRILYRAAMQGMITGVMLAIARVSGETAPLLFTALSNNNMSTDLNGWMASLPVVIFNFAMSPYDDWQRLAWAGALLITVVVLLLSITARAITRRGAM